METLQRNNMCGQTPLIMTILAAITTAFKIRLNAFSFINKTSLRRAISSLVYIPMLLAFSLLSTPSFAFKIDTHVWIAQQVLNDVLEDDKGLVTIGEFGEFPINRDLYTALAIYQDEFRMGSIGPDIFPDVIGGQLTTHPGLPGPNGWGSDRWLKEVLQAVGTPEQALASNRLNQLAFAYGYMTHAAADVFAHTYVNIYSGDIFDLTRGLEAEIRHMALEQYIKEHTPPLIDNAGNTLISYKSINAPAGFLSGLLILRSDVADQYREAGAVHLSSMYDYREGILEIEKKIREIKDQSDVEIGVLQTGVTEARTFLDGLKNKTYTIPEDCSWVSLHKYTPPVYICAPEVKVKPYPHKCYVDGYFICLQIEAAKIALDGLTSKLTIPKLFRDVTLTQLEESVRTWRKKVDKAIEQYIITSQEIAKELMKPNGDPVGKLENWVCEWAPVFAGVPNETMFPGCTIRTGIDAAVDIHKDVNTKIGEFISNEIGELFAWLFYPPYAVETLKDNVKQQFKDLAVEISNELLDESSLTRKLLTWRLTTRSDADLNSLFHGDSSNKGIISIIGEAPNYYDEVVPRVKAEMHLVDGYFDPEKYSVIHNAIMLSKLALLDASQLNKLVKRAGIDSTIYARDSDDRDLYHTDTFVNILVDSIASIDGNHQWQEYPLPYPRKAGDDYGDGIPRDGGTPIQYGYTYSSPEKGFRLWQDCEVREQVFKKIFSGPIAPGLETPDIFGLSSVPDYKNPTSVSVENPFPLSSSSILILKQLTKDPNFNLSNWLADGDLSGMLSTDQQYVSAVTLAPAELLGSMYSYFKPVGTVKNMVIDLKAQTCGGGLALDSINVGPVTTFKQASAGVLANDIVKLDKRWSFTKESGCTYSCECTKPPYCYVDSTGTTICPPVSCECSSAECGTLPYKLTNAYETYDFGLSAADNNQCGACHGPDAPEMSVGTWLLKSKFVPGIPVGKGIEFNGSLICDATAIQTKLVMKAVDTKDVFMKVTDTQTGQISVAKTSKAISYPGLQSTYTDWRNVDKAILSNSNGTKGACDVIHIADASSFEPDTVPPSLKVSKDALSTVLSCTQLREREAAGDTVVDIIGIPGVADNRDPDVTLTNNAPMTLTLGTTGITWTASDDAQNTVSVLQTVTVVDDEAPVFTSKPATLTITATDQAATTVKLSPPTANDACDGKLLATTDTDLSALLIGANVIVWTVTDSSGNQSQLTQEVTVKPILGDLDLNGLIEANDLLVFIDELDTLITNNPVNKDYNNDGVTDNHDQDFMDFLITAELGLRDFNSDKKINELDARLLLRMISPNDKLDVDTDSILDINDNCVSKTNVDQTDLDGDGMGGICDIDGDTAPPVDPVKPSGSGSGSSGGCTINPMGAFDPSLLLMILVSLLYITKPLRWMKK